MKQERVGLGKFLPSVGVSLFRWNFIMRGGVGQNSFGSGELVRIHYRVGRISRNSFRNRGTACNFFGSGCNWSKFLHELKGSVKISAKVGDW